TRLGKSGQTICVGDRVRLEGVDWAAGRGAVAALEPRATRLDRPAVANVTRIVVVASLAEPLLDPLQLTRFLLTAEATGCAVLLVFSKADLLPPAEVASWCSRGRAWGYEPVAVSSATGMGLEVLRERLSGPGISVLCGPSGVGKSSVLNGLLPGLELRVGEVSGRLQRGRHTTRHVELFPLAPSARVADTPGFNRPLLPPDPAALAPLFPEVRAALARHGGCRFSNCLHLGEPGCVLGLEWDRWPLYRQCLAVLQADAERRGTRPASSAEGPGLRRRGGGLEPRLAPQLRQVSRRRQRQQVASESELPNALPSEPPAGAEEC
ncbi:ribosome small subunit-dependent GTPase A, partial [Aphanothece stagnina]